VLGQEEQKQRIEKKKIIKKRKEESGMGIEERVVRII
jgi:hypothetical protein